MGVKKELTLENKLRELREAGF